ncbi:hypothetical protein F3N42_01520 [Marinihelvus fidelis]|uniref:NusG-like N-terminal domain-containing protein n=1 Tax=Marinihelvus fidelis TaxID=2613842 RepID=A0A5N0TEL6_9GAMM|nr:transcription termination/antitermination NusG family protein [Marinihelvus fidelis]KAA9133068.1 hypothetical protein F3N42_01520 [Marinihelvus fidelis]
MEWFAVYTRPRQERVAREHLQRQGFDCFLPLAENPYQKLRRQKLRAEPLFPRYLFLQAEPGRQNLAVVRSTRGAVDLVRTGCSLLQVDAGVIQALRSRQDDATGLIRLAPDPVRVGDRVQVFTGPLAGLEGVLAERCGETRAMLMLGLLGRSTLVEVDALALKRAV